MPAPSSPRVNLRSCLPSAVAASAPLAFLGHLSIDLNTIAGVTARRFGGGVLHAGVTAARLGAEVQVLTACAPGDRAHFAALGDAGARVEFLASDSSTMIENLYPNGDPDARQSRCVTQARAFRADDLGWLSASAVHVNPLIVGEFPDDLFAPLREQVQFLGADAQGFIRANGSRGADGVVSRAAPSSGMGYREWARADEILPMLDLLKVDCKEAAFITGERDLARAGRQLQARGVTTVVLTHGSGVMVFDGPQRYEAPFQMNGLEGRTGRGDTCTAAYLVARAQSSPQEATTFAAAVASEKMRYPGPYQGPKTAVARAV